MVVETTGFNATKLSSYCRDRGLFAEQVDRWRQTVQDANANTVLTMAEQKELETLRAQDQLEIKTLIYAVFSVGIKGAATQAEGHGGDGGLALQIQNAGADQPVAGGNLNWYGLMNH